MREACGAIPIKIVGMWFAFGSCQLTDYEIIWVLKIYKVQNIWKPSNPTP